MACNGRHSWLEYAYMSKHVKTKHLVDLHSFSCFFELMTRIVATDENWWRLWWRLMVGSRRKLARHIIHYNTIKWHNMKKDDAILINSDQRKFRSQTSDLWTDAATREESEGRQKRRSHRRERARREDQSAGKGRKSRETLCFFQCFEDPQGRKVGSLKQRDVEKVHAVVARGISRSKCWTHIRTHVRTTFGSWDVKKAHARSNTKCKE